MDIYDPANPDFVYPNDVPMELRDIHSGPKRARPAFVSCTQLLATAGFRMNGIVPLCNDAMIIEAIPA